MENIDLSKTEAMKPRWLGSDQFGLKLEVTNVVNVSKDKSRLDLEMTVKAPNGNEYRFSLWGKNLVYMANTFGSIVPSWKGQMIRVFPEEVNGKTHRRIERF